MPAELVPIFLDPLFLGIIVFQVTILLVLRSGFREDNVPAMVNAVVAFVVVVAIVGLETWAALTGITAPEPRWVMSVWIAAAGCLHAVGMLGPYDSIWWWDHFTHALAAAFLGAVIYGAILVTIDWIDVAAGRTIIAVATIMIMLLAGVCWELIELVARELGEQFDVEPVLVNYGRLDTTLDLVFDLVGVMVILGLDVQVFVPIAASAPGTTAVIVGSGISLLVVVTLALTVVVMLSLQQRSS